jgi:membrane fusion protein (multidrug efflux system)
MKLKFAGAVLIVAAVIGALAGVKALQIQKLVAGAKSFAQPPETVSSAVVKEETWQNTLSAIGSVVAVQGVTVTPEVPGMVREITFESGALVNQGDVLVQLDADSEKAQLRSIEAQLDLARLNLDRAGNLLKDRMVSQAEYDTAEAAMKQATANAETIKTTIAKKTIRAPFAGKLGIRQINLGQYLEAGKAIVVLQSLKPVFGDFSLPQQELAKLKTGMKARLSTDVYPGKVFEGSLTAINPGVDPSTRNVGLQATFENPEQLLRPGMFARLEVLLPESEKVLVIPATSIISAPFGDSVYVIEPNTGTNGASGLKVRQQFVRTGRPRGDFISVVTGLKAGETVARSGVFKLRNGMSVIVNNDLVPPTSETPKPSDS